MRNYLRENMERYRRMARSGAPAEYAEFSSRGFLDDAIPRLRLHRERPRVLELGTGTGPGAIHLAERGFAVHAVDLIPEAIAQARRAAAARGFDVRFEVMDITRIPRHGPLYDLIVDRVLPVPPLPHWTWAVPGTGSHGFKVLRQTGELGQHLVAAHRGAVCVLLNSVARAASYQ